jgi:hypothetical protein
MTGTLPLGTRVYRPKKNTSGTKMHLTFSLILFLQKGNNVGGRGKEN